MSTPRLAELYPDPEPLGEMYVSGMDIAVRQGEADRELGARIRAVAQAAAALGALAGRRELADPFCAGASSTCGTPPRRPWRRPPGCWPAWASLTCDAVAVKRWGVSVVAYATNVRARLLRETHRGQGTATRRARGSQQASPAPRLGGCRCR